MLGRLLSGNFTPILEFSESTSILGRTYSCVVLHSFTDSSSVGSHQFRMNPTTDTCIVPGEKLRTRGRKELIIIMPFLHAHVVGKALKSMSLMSRLVPVGSERTTYKTRTPLPHHGSLFMQPVPQNSLYNIILIEIFYVSH
jgi:hypothetical protein